MRHAICYISSLNEDTDPEVKRELLDHWQVNNEEQKIQGVLLYSEGNFFQILEGEKKKVLDLFEKIREDERHTGIIQVIGRDLEQGPYDNYLVDIVEENGYPGKLPPKYTEALQGFEPDLKKAMESMLETFLATRITIENSQLQGALKRLKLSSGRKED